MRPFPTFVPGPGGRGRALLKRQCAQGSNPMEEGPVALLWFPKQSQTLQRGHNPKPLLAAFGDSAKKRNCEPVQKALCMNVYFPSPKLRTPRIKVKQIKTNKNLLLSCCNLPLVQKETTPLQQSSPPLHTAFHHRLHQTAPCRAWESPAGMAAPNWDSVQTRPSSTRGNPLTQRNLGSLWTVFY